MLAIRAQRDRGGRHRAGDVDLIIHGTTLATNALIERKGAKTALLTTEGFRDVVEIRTKTVSSNTTSTSTCRRLWCRAACALPVRERVDAQGRVLMPLDESSVARAIDLSPRKRSRRWRSAFCTASPIRITSAASARRSRSRLPQVPVTLSSDVSPEMREYERFSTACANAYLQPLMGSYLGRLERELTGAAFACPLLLMTSGGGITTTDTAIRFPVRLVESGPAGGAIFAACIARQQGLDQVVSFDMGGTTAKICFIDKARPQTARAFEVARIYRFLKGSGLPLRIPVIEMVEIGAGGGSIARVDTLRPHQCRAGQRGLRAGTGLLRQRRQRTDRDRCRCRARPHRSGDVFRRPNAARRARRQELNCRKDRRTARSRATEHAALGISEIVDENMASAARVHAIESGKDLQRAR